MDRGRAAQRLLALCLGIVPDPLLNKGATHERAHQPDRNALQLWIVGQFLAEVPAADNACPSQEEVTGLLAIGWGLGARGVGVQARTTQRRSY